MDNLFDYAEACLHDADMAKKLALTHEAKMLLGYSGAVVAGFFFAAVDISGF